MAVGVDQGDGMLWVSCPVCRKGLLRFAPGGEAGSGTRIEIICRRCGGKVVVTLQPGLGSEQRVEYDAAGIQILSIAMQKM